MHCKTPSTGRQIPLGRGLKEQLVMRIEEGFWGICHGDLHGNTNVAFTDNGTLTYYDLEGADFDDGFTSKKTYKLIVQPYLETSPDREFKEKQINI